MLYEECDDEEGTNRAIDEDAQAYNQTPVFRYYSR
jgi:hypothetical protein